MSVDLYLDAAAGGPVAPAAREAILAALNAFGDPLSIHGAGRAARSLLEDARSVVARAIGAQADEIVFTSGGTESVALAIHGVATGSEARDRRIVAGAIEHPSVLGACATIARAGIESPCGP